MAAASPAPRDQKARNAQYEIQAQKSGMHGTTPNLPYREPPEHPRCLAVGPYQPRCPSCSAKSSPLSLLAGSGKRKAAYYVDLKAGR